MKFFFRNRQLTLNKFTDLFQSKSNKGDEQESEETNTGSYASFWGWFSTLYSLSKTNILSITGETSITKLNINFVLNYLAIEKDYKELERQAEKAAMNKSKNRRQLK